MVALEPLKTPAMHARCHDDLLLRLINIQVFGNGASSSGSIHALSVRCKDGQTVQLFSGTGAGAASFSLGVCPTGFTNWILQAGTATGALQVC